MVADMLTRGYLPRLARLAAKRCRFAVPHKSGRMPKREHRRSRQLSRMTQASDAAPPVTGTRHDPAITASGDGDAIDPQEDSPIRPGQPRSRRAKARRKHQGREVPRQCGPRGAQRPENCRAERRMKRRVRGPGKTAIRQRPAQDPRHRTGLESGTYDIPNGDNVKVRF